MFVKVLLVKLSDMLDSSNFVRLFHLQSFVLYGIMQAFICNILIGALHDKMCNSA